MSSGILAKLFGFFKSEATELCVNPTHIHIHVPGTQDVKTRLATLSRERYQNRGEACRGAMLCAPTTKHKERAWFSLTDLGFLADLQMVATHNTAGTPLFPDLHCLRDMHLPHHGLQIRHHIKRKMTVSRRLKSCRECML